jgi:hypothetical protein
MQTRILKTFALTSAIALASSPALATNDGTLSATSSQGDLDISVSIGDQVQVSNMNDIAFGTYTGTGALSAEDDICVYRNGSGEFQFKFTAGSNSGATDAAEGTTAFEVASATDTMAYTVDFGEGNDATYEHTGLAINTDTNSASGSAHQTSPSCGGGTNAKIRVNFTEATLQAAAPGDYVGTLYMTVAPR